jgi:PAS domain S-box-containing protein
MSNEQTQAFLAAIVESSDDSIVATDVQGTILAWNSGSERLWGYSAAEVLGKHISLLYPADRQEEYQHNLSLIQHRERVERFESVRVRKDGSPIDVSVILSSINDTDGKLCGISAVYRDMTEHKRAEADLLKSKKAAEVANQARGEFLANMSHEIRTPMNGIIGMLELALETPSPEDLRDYLETAHASAEAMLALINDVLDFSKIDAGRMQLEETPLSIPALIDESLKSLAVMAAKKGLELRQEVDCDLPLMLIGDPTRLRQVLLNLLNNAIKFTQKGFIEVKAAIQGQQTGAVIVRFSVTDTGIGISVAQQDVIFEAFRQADSSTTRHYGGTGLGLSISRRLVRLMGGELSVESHPEIGSTFSFTTVLKRSQ